MVSPGEPLPANEDGSSPSTPTPTAAHGKKLSSGAIAGIAVAGVVGVGLIGAFLFVLGRNSRILSRRKDSSTNLPSHPYSSKPMSYDPYAPLSPYGIPIPQSPPAELSTPQPDQNKHASFLSGETAYDDARWQTVTPTPTQQAPVRLELDASPPQGSMLRDTRAYWEDLRRRLLQDCTALIFWMYWKNSCDRFWLFWVVWTGSPRPMTLKCNLVSQVHRPFSLSGNWLNSDRTPGCAFMNEKYQFRRVYSNQEGQENDEQC